MGTCRSAVGYAVGVALGIGLMPVTAALGDDQAAWIKLAVILALFSGIGLFCAWRGSKEIYHEEGAAAEEERNLPLLKGIGILFRNKYWIVMTIFGVCMNIMYAMVLTSGVYYAQAVVGDMNFYSTINTVNLIPSVIGFLTVGALIKRIGLTKTARLASVIGIVGSVIRLMAPANALCYLIGGSIVMYATIPLISVMPAMVLNTSEANVKLGGARMTGMTNAGNSFVGKIGSGLGGSLIGWILAAGGYDKFAAGGELTAGVTNSVYLLNFWVPLAMFIIMFVFLVRYDLEDKLPAMIEENNRYLAEKYQA